MCRYPALEGEAVLMRLPYLFLHHPAVLPFDQTAEHRPQLFHLLAQSGQAAAQLG
jgi:hypothetical protein